MSLIDEKWLRSYEP